MIEILLLIHILGAVATGVAGAFAMFALWNTRADTYRTCAIVLGIFSGFEIVTGSILSITSQRISAGMVCERLALYLVLVAVIESMLYVRMRKVTAPFPVNAVLSPTAAALTLLFATLASGF